MIQKRLPGAAEETGNFAPGIRSAHIHNPDRFDPRLWWFNTEDARGLAALNTAPELTLGRDNEVLVKRIGVGSDFDPFAPSGNDREDRSPGWNDPHIMLQLRHVFLGRRVSRQSRRRAASSLPIMMLASEPPMK